MNKRDKSMTDSEKKIFRILSYEPMISQIDLAKRVGISRSSASVHISNLSKKGYIVGRGYVMSEYASIVVIGASMIDLYGKSRDPLLDGESNPGKVTIFPGGVSRNISENLSRLGVKINLITSICDDPFGEIIKNNCESLGIDYSHSYFLENEASTIYMAILDNDGEMKMALSDTTALDKMPLDHIIRKEAVIERAEVIVMDASLPEDIMHYIVDHNKDKITIIDPVSIGKAHKLKNFIGKFHTVKCNLNEAEYLSGIKITDQQSLEQASASLMDKGVKQVFITMGAKGVHYHNEFEQGQMETMANEIVNVTGAGDAFTAGVAYCALSNLNITETAKFASAMSSFSLASIRAVSPELALHKINDIIDK